MQQRRDEILAKKAKLAELKRQRELRAAQANAGRADVDVLVLQLVAPIPGHKNDRKREIEDMIERLVGESPC
ncbi:hypothetical protein ONZ43_g1608 [Nemania bipapillata]|uniref:Uncharacterized protein n=1 Tax=Nemania bipapillata TaxID=110536 RepID=A0ACC2J456_9PEZI|nr:hypothetical protein ONZ43_g1608 [Nemania bipapillata]